MSVDPRTPVIVGRAQVVGPPVDLEHPVHPIDLMATATRTALADAGLPAATVDTVGVIGGIHRHPNPAGAIAHHIGCPDAHSIVTTWGGNTPVAFLGELGRRIVAGSVDVAVFVGGEANRTRDALRRVDRDVEWTGGPDGGEPETWGTALKMGGAEVIERGGEMPRNTYAVFDSALRAAAAESLDEARDRDAALWAGYSAVAAENPDLDTDAMDAATIRTPSADNRMVSWPYTKAMCANNRVDQAGALIVCSAEAADRLGVPAANRVYLHDTVNASDTDSFLVRDRLDEVPGLDGAAAVLQQRWGPLDELAHVDLYGCFPSIVHYTANALGLRPGRDLTVTGGLGFMGAPLNFAAGQSLIGMIRVLRDDPGSFGLVQGNGGHAAKHAFGIYSTTPPDSLPTITTLDHDQVVVPMADGAAGGTATIDGITVEYGRRGPERAIAVCRLDGHGGRLWATSADPAVMEAATTRELVGAGAVIVAGEFSL